jgi:hypothetical protein
MKKTYFIFAILLSVTAIISCKKNARQDLPLVELGAQIKFFNFAPNSPTVNFFANTDKISGTLTTSTTVSTTGVSYGSVFPASNYASVRSGAYAFKGQIPESATTDANLAVSNLQASVEAGKYYSLYTCGFYNNTAKTTDAFMVADIFPVADTSAAYIRLVNTISNANPLTFVLKTNGVETTIATEIAYKSASVFVKVPEAVYDLYARNTGSSTNIITRTAVSFLKGRVYSISARGDITIVSTTLTNRPFFDSTTNR